MAELLAELALADAAMHGGMLHLWLALQHSNDLRHDRQDLPHDFVHVLRAQLPRRLAKGSLAVRRVTDSSERRLRLREDVRQRRYQLPHDLAHVLL